MQDTQVQSLGCEDPLEKGMATQSSIFAWRISWTVGPGGLQFMGSQSVSHNGPRARTRVHTHKHTRADSPIETNAPSGGDVDGGRCCGGRGYIQEIAVIWAHIF